MCMCVLFKVMVTHSHKKDAYLDPPGAFIATQFSLQIISLN